jgi:hypothetical protein
MTQLDEVIRTELQGGSRDEPTPDLIWAEVSRRVIRRRHKRSVRRRTGVCLSLVVVLVAAGLIVGLPTNGRAPHLGSQPRIIDPPAGPGGFSVVPSAGLVNNQTVTVSIHGLHSNAVVWITMCVGRPKTYQTGVNQCDAPAKMVSLDSHGAASVAFAVSRYLSPGGYQLDCASYKFGCSVALLEPDSLSSGKIIGNTEAVAFEGTPTAPPNPLQISAAPSGPYADGQTITVSGAGFPSSSAVRVAECPTNTDCGDYFQTVESTSQGTFRAAVILHRTYTVEQGDADGGESPVQIDCSQPLRCFLMAEESLPPYKAASSIPLTFASTPSSGAS